MSKSEYSGGQMALAFLGGAAAGAAIAYLTAPKSGRELRSDMRDYVESRRDDVRSYVDDHTRGVRKLPDAARAAGTAAREAFNESMNEHDSKSNVGALPSNAVE